MMNFENKSGRVERSDTLYRVIQEGRSMFWDVVLSEIVRNKVHVNNFYS